AFGTLPFEVGAKIRRDCLHGGFNRPARRGRGVAGTDTEASQRLLGTAFATDRDLIRGARGTKLRGTGWKLKPTLGVGRAVARDGTRPMMFEVLADRERDVDTSAATRSSAGGVGTHEVTKQLLPQPQQQDVDIGERDAVPIDRLAIGAGRQPAQQRQS